MEGEPLLSFCLTLDNLNLVPGRAEPLQSRSSCGSTLPDAMRTRLPRPLPFPVPLASETLALLLVHRAGPPLADVGPVCLGLGNTLGEESGVLGLHHIISTRDMRRERKR